MKWSLLIALVSLFHFGSTSAQEWTSLSSGTSVSLNDIHVVDASIAYVAGANGTVLKTADGGTTWNDVSPEGENTTFNAVHFFDPETGSVAGAGGTTYRTSDGGGSWYSVDSGVRDELMAMSFSGDYGTIGGRALDILSSDDAGESWDFIDGGYFCGNNYGAFQLDELTAYVVGDNCIFQPLVQWTTDGWATWNFSIFYLNGNEGTLHDVYFLDADNGFAVSNSWTGEGGISQTLNGGVDWTTTLYPDALYGIDFPTAGTGYVVGISGAIMRSDDGGVTWTDEVSGSSSWLQAVSFIDAETGYAVGDGGTILKREGDAGGIPCDAVTSFWGACIQTDILMARIFLSGSVKYVGEEVVFNVDGTDHPVYLETNGSGHSKAKLNLRDQNLGEHTVSLVTPDGCYEPLTVICDSVLQREIEEWMLEDLDINIAGDEVSSVGIPLNTEIFGNYPNPFNPSTTISYGLSQDGPVKLKVYTMLGEEVATLVDEFQSAGYRNVTWEGQSSDGAPVASGLYLYRLATTDVVQTGKMILMK